MIRVAVPQDVERVTELCRDDNLKSPNNHFPDAEWIGTLIQQGNSFVYIDDNDETIGVVIAEKLQADGVLLWMLVVSKEHRGKGVASNLVKEFERQMSLKGKDWIILYSSNEPESVDDFYIKLGFTSGRHHTEMTKNIGQKY